MWRQRIYLWVDLRDKYSQIIFYELTLLSDDHGNLGANISVTSMFTGCFLKWWDWKYKHNYDLHYMYRNWKIEVC